ncbi:MAG: hypothetical protein MUF48_06375 [Pirellulaceae bacterium]|jgi:hypothetical protein|nr:hypothetical protein [Pirellulaceae bacterium]
MTCRSTRRAFLQGLAAVGTCLTLPPSKPAAALRSRAGEGIAPAATPGASTAQQGVGCRSLVTVVTQATSRDVNPRGPSWVGVREVLQRAGVFFVEVSPEQLSTLPPETLSLVLLAGDLRLMADQRQRLVDAVRRGGALIGIGGTSGLDDVFGVRGTSPMAEGWLAVAAVDHPVVAGLRSSLHVFGGCAAATAAGVTLAAWDAGSQAARGAAIVEHVCGQGCALLLAPDLLFSIVHIQQGRPVLQDAAPSPDGPALTNDGMLKAEDGLVLDWQRDRQLLEPDRAPAFLEPVSDELRELVLRSLFYVARRQGIRLPLLWYWPRSLPAVGHISHDSDGNDPPLATAMLDVVNRCQIKSTWCMLYPGGYPREFYRLLQDQEHEIALHYDAMSGARETSWSKENFSRQHAWLLQEAGLSHLTSNKNHYTRWEQRLDFLRWCAEIGIQADQTRGPSKKGTIGFPLGGSQPYFPLDDERDDPRFLPVLEVNLLTQDLVVVCPREYGGQLLDAATRHHGVAHFLFHPAHIRKPGVAEALSALVDDGRSRGLEWWTSAQIYQWETLRRGVQVSGKSDNIMTLSTGQPVRDATLLVLRVGPDHAPLRINGRAVPVAGQSFCGFDFDAVTLDLAGETVLQA